MLLDEFNYFLPPELIASNPPQHRGQSKLLVVEGATLQDKCFSDIINYINEDDLIVFNDSKVIKARLFGVRPTGGKVELLVERIIDNKTVVAHIHCNKTIRLDLEIILPGNLKARVIQRLSSLFKLEISQEVDFYQYLEKFGQIPLPPYIKRQAQQLDVNRYQTIYAKKNGSVAAPTAGLHFTQKLLDSISDKGAKIGFITLHVGAGTFKPVTAHNIADHKMHSEIYQIDTDIINQINQTQARNGKIIAVGTTSLRTLESMAQGNASPGTYETDIFITPEYRFRMVDKLVTNFHLPKSSLLMLVAAFIGLESMKSVYNHAIDRKYRFFSYGDAMFLTRGVR